MRSRNHNFASTRLRRGGPYSIEPLEQRVLLADSIVSIRAKLDATEASPLGFGFGEFTVLRTGELTAPMDVNVRFSPGGSSATSGQDLLAPVRSVHIPAGRRYVYFKVYPLEDSIAEGTETIVMKLMPGDYTLNPSRQVARIKLHDNETRVSIFASRPQASETDPTGSGMGQFRFVREGPTARPLVVRLYLRSTNTAINGRDFLALPGSVTIPVGKVDTFLNVFPIDDQRQEPTETLFLTIRAKSDYARAHHSAPITISDNDGGGGVEGWWNDNWDFRVPITVSPASHERSDHPVERSINFTQLLSNFGGGSLIENSIRVIETSADGLSVVDEDVPFQFDKAPNFDALTNASGTLVFLMKGDTSASQTRHYHVYFDNGGTFAAPTITPLVTTTDNVVDEGFTSVRVATPGTTYFYHKAEGGFSSIVDADGNDWVGWNSAPGSAGEFRGLPNLGGAGFHPGQGSDITTVIASQGPLKTVLDSTDPDGNKVRWEFFPAFARATILSINQNYFFLYEGTPGGAIDANDLVVRSDGTHTGIDSEWSDTDGLGSATGQEWVYFSDSTVGSAGRFFYLSHHQTDGLEDSYFNLDNNMTVFGFGRRNNPSSEPDPLLRATPNTFTIGLEDGGEFAAAAGVINGAYQNLNTSQGAAQSRI